MINERMTELLLLMWCLDGLENENEVLEETELNGTYYNLHEMIHRRDTLLKEFLSPYVINKDLKE